MLGGAGDRPAATPGCCALTDINSCCILANTAWETELGGAQCSINVLFHQSAVPSVLILSTAPAARIISALDLHLRVFLSMVVHRLTRAAAQFAAASQRRTIALVCFGSTRLVICCCRMRQNGSTMDGRFVAKSYRREGRQEDIVSQ